MQLLPLLSPKTPNSSSHLKNIILLSCSVCITYFFLSLVLLHTSSMVDLSSSRDISQPTSIDHIVFGIASNQKSWPKRKEYVKLWWRSDQMRGCVFTDNMTRTDNDSGSGSLPPMCMSGDTARFRYTCKGGLRSAIRVARVVSETVALNHSNVRWFVFGDDDTVFFTENLVKTLSKYDHELWHYIGTNSEVVVQNMFFSYEMAFGGAGFAISYPLAKVLAKVFDSCLERYPHLYGSDGRVHACIAELGIGLTKEPGFHQMDVRGNVFGLLAAHPNTPLVSLHHLDHTAPIFPNMTTTDALNHLIQASKLDPHRLLQQTVCYDPRFSWTVSVSWGYAVQVFATHVFLPDVIRTERTFGPWKRDHPFADSFMFNTRVQHPFPCRRPVVFYFDGAGSGDDGVVKSRYYRRRIAAENWNCSSFNASSARKLEEVRVVSKKLDLGVKQLQAPRRHCCDILPSTAGKVMEIAIRECQEEELVYMHQ